MAIRIDPATGLKTFDTRAAKAPVAITGQGYWFVAADGGIFSFGDAAFFGSTGATPPARPIVGMASSPTGDGYWFVTSDGTVIGFGDATAFGTSGTGTPGAGTVVGLIDRAL